MQFEVALIVVAILIAVLFLFMQWLSDKTYRPSEADVRRVILKTIEGKLNADDFDEFSNVKIAYDERLEKIRQQYYSVVTSDRFLSTFDQQVKQTIINEEGKAKLRQLLAELDSEGKGVRS